MKKLFISLSFLFPSVVFADVDFHSYGGFETVVNGFTYMRNVYGNAQYGLLVFTILVMAVFISTSLNAVKGLTGQGKASTMLSQIFFCCLGFAIYQGTIIPKTTIHIYDNVLNKYQAVDQVPLLIATLAGGVNGLERIGSDTFAAHTLNRAEHGGGATIQLLSTVLNQDPLKYKPYLSKSIEHYIDDCMPPALTSSLGSYGTFDLNKILHETNDLVGELAKLASTYQMTVYYDAANRGGNSVTCNAAWASISSLITLPATYNQHYSDVCKKGGFETDVATCKTRLSTIADYAMDSTSSMGVDNIAGNQALAQNLYRNLAENPVAYMEDMINLKNQSTGLSTLVAAGSWLPTIRYSTMMIIVGIMPLITLMFFTPMLGTALKYTAGLLLFTAIWGLTDTAIHGITLANIEDQLASLQTTNFSVYTFMTAPNDLQKAVATMGKMQSMGLMLATILVGTFFKISGRAFANMGEKLQSDIDKIGGEVGGQVFDPSQRMQTMNSHMTADRQMGELGSMGTERYADAHTAPNIRQLKTDDKYFEDVGGTANSVLDREAAITAGQQSGKLQMKEKLAEQNGTTPTDLARILAAQETTNQTRETIATYDATNEGAEIAGYENPADLLKDNKLNNLMNEQANLDKALNVEGVTGADDILEAKKRMEAANVQVALDKKDLDTIDTAGGGEFVNPQSFAQFEENGGSGVGTISFSPDGSGKPVNVSTLTQSSATSDDSSEFKEGTHADKGKIADLMDTTTEGVLSDAGLNLAKQALSGESRATENSLIDGMSDAMYGSFNASDTDSSAIQANAGADAQIDLSGLLKLGAGALKKMGGDKGPEGGVIDKVADLADTFGLKMKAGAGWSGANTDKDSRDVQGRALMAYILESYQEQYDLADSEIEQTRIANEMADVMMTTKDSLDQAFLEIGGNELDDININNETMNDEVLDWMEDMQEIRDEKYGR